MTMVEDVLQPDMLERLRELKSFRDYEARVKASADVEAEEKARAVAAEAEERARAAEAKARAAEAMAIMAEEKAEAKVKAEDLIQFFLARGEKPSAHAYDQITGCTDIRKLGPWLSRAYAGETSAQIFPEE